MKDYQCNKEDQITKINTKLDIVYKEVMGNGKEGLAKTSIRLEEAVKTLNPIVEALQISISGINKFMIESEVIVRENAKHKQNKKWFITTIITLGGFLVALSGLFLFKN